MKTFKTFLIESINKEENKLIKKAGITRNPEVRTSLSQNGDVLIHHKSWVAGKLPKGTWEKHAPKIFKLHNPEPNKKKNKAKKK